MRGALIDANLLCLLTIGSADRRAIASHPRLKAFEVTDLDMVGSVVERVGDPVLCPHVLAETSNLIQYRQTPSQRDRWFASLAAFVRLFAERSEAAATAVGDPAYRWLGLTDAMLLLLAADDELTLVSDDLHLCLEAQRRGRRVLNYNHLRDGSVHIDQL